MRRLWLRSKAGPQRGRGRPASLFGRRPAAGTPQFDAPIYTPLIPASTSPRTAPCPHKSLYLAPTPPARTPPTHTHTRAPAGLIKQFLKDVHWGPCDYLVIDSPPGTSDEHISIAQVGLRVWGCCVCVCVHGVSKWGCVRGGGGLVGVGMGVVGLCRGWLVCACWCGVRGGCDTSVPSILVVVGWV